MTNAVLQGAKKSNLLPIRFWFGFGPRLQEELGLSLRRNAARMHDSGGVLSHRLWHLGGVLKVLSVFKCDNLFLKLLRLWIRVPDGGAVEKRQKQSVVGQKGSLKLLSKCKRSEISKIPAM